MRESKHLNGTFLNLIQKIWGVFRLDAPQISPVKAPDMIENLESAWRDWQYAKKYFNSVSDPDLIDHAIFYMGATEKKYVYLLKKAKETGVNIDRLSFASRVS
jgi:hypothetical protein